MEYLLLELPREFSIIVDLLKEQDWLLSNFDVSEDKLYNPAGYVYNCDLYGCHYQIFLDRNIFRFITSAISKASPNKKQRAAIALIYFCQASNIHFEPNMAVYERLLPKRNNTDIAINELINFYRVDNAEPD